MGLTVLDLSEARATLLKARKVQRQRFHARYEAARRDRLTGDWFTGIRSFNQELGADQELVVGRARDLAQNDTAMSKFLSSVRKNVFGPDGIKLQSRILLQRGGRPNDALNRRIEAAWMEWGKKENCTLDGRMSWCQLQHFLANEVPTDGEAFLRMVFTRQNIFGFTLEVISTDQIDRTYGRNQPLFLPNGNSVFMGIEMSGNKKVVAYHVFTQHPSEYSSAGKERERIPADEILHIYRKDKAGQVRGIPWPACSMFAMQMLAKYKEAELVASRMGASASLYVTSDIDPSADYTGEESPDNPNPADADIPWEPGMVGKLSPGQAITLVDPKHPTTQYGEFIKDSKLDIAAGLGISNMTLSGDVSSANYSSARVGLLDERDEWETLQYFFVDELCNPVFTNWLRMAFIAYPGLSTLDGGDWQRYNFPEWHPRSFPWVDPEKDASAVQIKLQTGLTTLTRELAAIGYDFEQTMAERKKEQDLLREYGMEDLIAVYAPQQKTPAAAAPGNGQDEAPPPAKKPAPRDSQLVNGPEPPGLLGNLTEIVNVKHKGK